MGGSITASFCNYLQIGKYYYDIVQNSGVILLLVNYINV